MEKGIFEQAILHLSRLLKQCNEMSFNGNNNAVVRGKWSPACQNTRCSADLKHDPLGHESQSWGTMRPNPGDTGVVIAQVISHCILCPYIVDSGCCPLLYKLSFSYCVSCTSRTGCHRYQSHRPFTSRSIINSRRVGAIYDNSIR